VQNGLMPADRAQLSSISASLGELTKRIGSMAEQAGAVGDETVAGELYSVERALQAATRRLERLLSGG
jgi:hypothetical protein